MINVINAIIATSATIDNIVITSPVRAAVSLKLSKAVSVALQGLHITENIKKQITDEAIAFIIYIPFSRAYMFVYIIIRFYELFFNVL